MATTKENNRKNRDEQLEYLMRRFGDKVLQLTFSYLRDREEAEDAAQEVFLRVYNSLDKFKGESSLFTWIYQITVNLCRDRLRKRNFFKWEYLSEDNITYKMPGPEQQAITSFEEQAVLKAVLELPLPYREAIVLHYLNQLTVKEVAEVTGTSTAAAKIRLYRARKKLKEILKNRGVDYVE